MGKSRRSKSSAVNKESFPLVRWKKLGGNPPPISSAGRYVKRVVKVDIEIGGHLTVGAISTALGHAGDFVITMLRCWAASSGNATFLANTFVAYPNNLISGAPATTDNLSVYDAGTGSSRPAVSFEVPRAHASIQNYDTASTVKVVSSATTGAHVYVTCWQYAA